ncbi:LysR family transcriptional regulator [Pseudomonas sp. S9]|uniref:LysR family transcriptional regulator n=1 Tax=Pseudomonas sp. S9 TaxID=686578 RepID=UPI0002556A17|nr:LysR family transcriptional regulator [Pseudomonas sp. S9]
MDISFRQLRAFTLVAQTLSFTRTSELLHLSPPALSYSIRRLEEALGLKLLARNTRSVELTPAGEHFLPQAQQLLRVMGDAVSDAQELLNLDSGTLRLAALPTAAASFLPRVIAAYSREHPGVQVSLLDGRAGEVRDWVLAGEVDVGITSLPQDMLGLEFKHLVNDNLVLLVRDEGGDLESWKTKPYIALAADTSIRPLADMTLLSLGVNAQPTWQVAHMSTAAAMVREGLGFTLLPASCSSFLQFGEALLVLPVAQPVQRSLGLLQRKPVRQTPALQIFMQYLDSRLSQAFA